MSTLSSEWRIIAKWVLAMIPVLSSLLAAGGILHYFQLESYQFPGFFRTLKRNYQKSIFPGLCVTVTSLLLYYIFYSVWDQSSNTVILLLILMLPISALIGYIIKRIFTVKKAKKKFAYTGRVKRLYVVFFIVMTIISYALSTLPWAILPAMWPILLPLVAALAGLLAWPIEKIISECYFRDARKKLLANPKLIRIGITGSYGKTSVKYILGTILSEKYPTLITPASFNTPMGVTRTIREKLTPSYQVFVGEMGARHVGDIKEMCRPVHPTIGIVTSVGPQHLETFKTIERVAKTKYELIDKLPKEDSHAYFYDDQSFCRQMYHKTSKNKTLCAKDSPSADAWFSDVSVSAQGSTFMLHIKDKGSIECQTKLLGEHNIQNITLAAAVASDLHLSLKQISHGIVKLQPIQHRLELLNHQGSFTIINDAFNSNPVGAKAALEVLKGFPSRRIIITPGMVELGEKEEAYNREFGKNMVGCVDVAIIVGKNRATPIIEGLLEAGFPKDAIHRVDSLDQSTVLLHSMVLPTDTVLYENDLPDNYQDA